MRGDRDGDRNGNRRGVGSGIACGVMLSGGSLWDRMKVGLCAGVERTNPHLEDHKIRSCTTACDRHAFLYVFMNHAEILNMSIDWRRKL